MWVPRLLKNQQRVDNSERCLQWFQRNKKECWRKYVTMHETQVHHFAAESNRQQLKAVQSYQRRKNQQISVFWDVQGFLFIDYLEKGRTINNEYYIALLVRLKEEIVKKKKNGHK